MITSDQIRMNDLLYVADLGHIYKYTSIKSGSSLLENSTLNFNSPLNFNDPFDCHPLLVKISDEYIYNVLNASEYKNHLNREGFTKSPIYLNFIKDFSRTQAIEVETKILPNVKVSCFSERGDNLLMWSHYSQNHTGICFEFDTTNMITFLAKYSNIKVLAGVFLKVNYNHERKNYVFQSAKDTLPLIMWLKTKAIDWEYEKEIRLIFLRCELDQINIPTNIVRRVLLGSKVSPKDEQRIVELCEKNFPATKIVKMRLSEQEFKLLEEPSLV